MMIWDLELTTGLIHFRSTKQQQNAANQAPPTLLCHFAARFQKQSNWNLLSSWLELWQAHIGMLHLIALAMMSEG